MVWVVRIAGKTPSLLNRLPQLEEWNLTEAARGRAYHLLLKPAPYLRNSALGFILP